MVQAMSVNSPTLQTVRPMTGIPMPLFDLPCYSLQYGGLGMTSGHGEMYSPSDSMESHPLSAVAAVVAATATVTTADPNILLPTSANPIPIPNLTPSPELPVRVSKYQLEASLQSPASTGSTQHYQTSTFKK